jgi:bifunctional non-homologous end joining protein LigD
LIPSSGGNRLAYISGSPPHSGQVISPTPGAGSAPERYVTSAALAKRPRKLFIYYLRNGRGTRAIGAWSPRARTGFPIAAPVTWRDVEKGIAADAVTIVSISAQPRRRRVDR